MVNHNKIQYLSGIYMASNSDYKLQIKQKNYVTMHGDGKEWEKTI